MLVDSGVNSGGGTGVGDDHQPIQEGSEPRWGLLRMEDKLWLLASEMDLDKVENFLSLLLRSMKFLPDWEGYCKSIFMIFFDSKSGFQYSNQCGRSSAEPEEQTSI